jgi:hypothetical protein
MSSDLLNAIFYKKISSSASIHLNSTTYQKTNYLFLMNLLEKAELDFKILNFDPLFYRFYLSYRQPNKKYNVSSGFTFFSSTDLIQDIFSSINKNTNNLLIIGVNLLELEKIKEFFYYLNYAKSINSFSKIIIISFDCNNSINNIINNNCVFSLNEISHAKNNNKLFLKYDFYNHKKLNKENIVFSYELNEQRGLINKFGEILLHNLELQKIFNEVEKPIEHKTQMNLNLTEEERKAKNDLVLPFLKTEEEKKKAFEIIQNDETNEEDEFEEDPDQDLDI